MLRFRTLGLVEVRRSDGEVSHEVRLQPKRVALLAYLAVGTPRGPQRRDRLLGLFWPDHDESRARNALRQALHGLRQRLGESTFLSDKEGAVGLAQNELWCDAVAFDDAVAHGNLEEAVSLYAGPFLHGFYLSGASEFERWVERERERLERRYGAALEQLAIDAEARSDFRAAAEWWRQAAEHDRYSTHIAVHRMRALAAAGDRAGAIRHAERHTTALREELDAEPDPQVTTLAEELRRRPSRNAAVRIEPAAVPQTTPSAPPFASEPPVLQSPQPWFRRASVWMGSAVAVVLLLFAVRVVSTDSRSPAGTDPRLAVLPFENLGAPEYVVAGVSDELTARLAGASGIAIISSNSTGQYRDTDKSPTLIGQELGARFILLGSVKREDPGDSTSALRITPRLLNASDGTHLWADVYTANLGNLFDVTSEIAGAVGELLEVAALHPEELGQIPRPTAISEAFELYLRGRDYYRRPQNEVNLRAALEMFEQSVLADPQFALVYAALSEVHGDLYWLGFDQTEERLQLSRAAVEEALSLDPTLPEAHSALGTYQYRCCLDFDGALAHYETARSYRPGIDLHAQIGAVMRQAGQWNQALASLHRAAELDPRSGRVLTLLGETYLLLRRFDEAEQYLRRAIALDPQLAEAYDALAQVYLFGLGDTDQALEIVHSAAGKVVGDIVTEQMVPFYQRRYRDALDGLLLGMTRSHTLAYVVGRGASVNAYLYIADMYRYLGDSVLAQVYYDSARVGLEEKLESPPSLPSAHTSLKSRLGRAYAGLGMDTDALREGREALELSRRVGDAIMIPAALQDFAVIHVMLRHSDAALDLLEESLSMPSLLTVPRLRISPTWDSLRDHPRFRALVPELTPTNPFEAG